MLQSMGSERVRHNLATKQQHIGYRDPDKHVLCV